MPRGVYQRTPTKSRTKRLPAPFSNQVAAAQHTPGINGSVRGSIQQLTLDLPDTGAIIILNNKAGKAVAKLVCNSQGMGIQVPGAKVKTCKLIPFATLAELAKSPWLNLG